MPEFFLLFSAYHDIKLSAPSPAPSLSTCYHVPHDDNGLNLRKCKPYQQMLFFIRVAIVILSLYSSIHPNKTKAGTKTKAGNKTKVGVLV